MRGHNIYFQREIGKLSQNCPTKSILVCRSFDFELLLKHFNFLKLLSHLLPFKVIDTGPFTSGMHILNKLLFRYR